VSNEPVISTALQTNEGPQLSSDKLKYARVRSGWQILNRQRFEPVPT